MARVPMKGDGPVNKFIGDKPHVEVLRRFTDDYSWAQLSEVGWLFRVEWFDYDTHKMVSTLTSDREAADAKFEKWVRGLAVKEGVKALGLKENE